MNHIVIRSLRIVSLGALFRRGGSSATDDLWYDAEGEKMTGRDGETMKVRTDHGIQK